MTNTSETQATNYSKLFQKWNYLPEFHRDREDEFKRLLLFLCLFIGSCVCLYSLEMFLEMYDSLVKVLAEASVIQSGPYILFDCNVIFFVPYIWKNSTQMWPSLLSYYLVAQLHLSVGGGVEQKIWNLWGKKRKSALHLLISASVSTSCYVCRDEKGDLKRLIPSAT